MKYQTMWNWILLKMITPKNLDYGFMDGFVVRCHIWGWLMKTHGLEKNTHISQINGGKMDRKLKGWKGLH